MISKQLLQELKIIIGEEYGENLDDSQVYAIGNGLVKYWDLLSKIFQKISQEKNEIINYDN